MKIHEMFEQLGLTPETISQLLADIALHNFQQPDNQLPSIKTTADIATIKMGLLPLIRRAIAKERGREFQDNEKQFPLVFDENAARYAAYELSKYYNAEHLFK